MLKKDLNHQYIAMLYYNSEAAKLARLAKQARGHAGSPLFRPDNFLYLLVDGHMDIYPLYYNLMWYNNGRFGT